ncbi:MAG TPA: amino acid adenylation domain-containing protein [Coleofasciculaceae cyanobacterium]|jgi:amino acid adenylation domain-containing protein
MNKENIADIYQLSPLQQGILFHSICEPETGVYCIQLGYRLRGNLNVKAFEQAWQQVVARHTVLRTAFHWEKLEKPLQVVYRQVPVSIQFEDWGTKRLEDEETLAAWLEKERKVGFNLAQAPLMRWHLIRCAEDDYYFVWSKHHLILDGWSTALVLQEVVQIYQTLCQSKQPSLDTIIPYRQYIAWLQEQDLSQAQQFWQTSLQGIKTPTPLGVGKQGDGEIGQRDEASFKLSSATTAALKSLAKENQLTLNTIIQGAWALLLHRYSSETDIVYGVTVSGRPTNLTGAESMVGLFINTLPVRVQIEAEECLLSWLKQLQTQLLEIRHYEYSPLVEIQGWSEVPRGLPLFESILVFENYPIDRTLQQQGSLTIESVTAFDHTNYPVTVTVIPGEELEIAIAYTTCRFDAATVTRMLGHLQTLLEGMITKPQTKVVDLPLLTVAEQSQLLAFNQTSTTIAVNKLQQCIHQLFESVVEKQPDAVAVVYNDRHITYQQLNQQANQIARYLQKLGVGADILIGIESDRSLVMISAILGILKAGGAYIPLDPNLPEPRLAFMLQDSGCEILLTQKHLLPRLNNYSGKVICLDSDWELITQEADTNLAHNPEPDNLAYTIYTSGSTGKPKGVMVNHSSLVNAYFAWSEAYQLSSLKNHLQMANFSFDVFTGDLVRALCSGGKLVLCPRDLLLEADKLNQLIQQHQIDCAEFVPVVLRNLMQYLEQTQQQLDMDLVICGSDSWYGREYVQFQQFLGKTTRLINSFGVTEATIDSTYFAKDTGKISPEQLVPIGKPFANTQLYILDPQMRSLPVGVAGELYIGGLGVARGYLNRPELTKEKFINNPCLVNSNNNYFSVQPSLDSLIYKTGDRARYLSNGNIEFLGRIDNQVKLRGFRIELGEVETILNQHSLVKENVVIIKEDNPDDKRLVAYIVPQSQQIDNSRTKLQLRNFLREKLPEYAIPSAFVFLEQLPISANGKIDRKSLPIPTETFDSTNNYIPATNAIEEILAGIWAKILHLQRVGIHDNFFDLGGHSLLATQVISRIREAFAIELPIRCLFESPSVAQLAQTLIEREAKPGVTAKRAQILQKIANLSPEEAKQLLQQRKDTAKAALK